MTPKFVGCLLSTLMVLGVCAPATAQGPIRIGASLSLTGTYAKLGKYQHEGYQLCNKELNAKGGLLGRKVEFVVYDDQSTPATGVRLYEKLITEDKVDAVMGPYSSPISEAVANVTEKYQKVMVSPLASTTSIFSKGRKYIFMVVSPAEVYLEGLDEMAAKRGIKTIAIVNEDTLFTKTRPRARPSSRRSTACRSSSRRPIPRATGLLGAPHQGQGGQPRRARGRHLLRRRHRHHAADEGAERQPQDVRGDGGRRPPGVLRSPQAERRVRLRRHPVGRRSRTRAPRSSSPPTRRSSGAEPSYHSAAVRGLPVYTEAVKRARTLESAKVREQLLKLETTTAFGDFKVDEDGFQVAHKMVMFQWQDGKKVIVWPDDLANAKPRFPTPSWNQR